MSVAALAKQAEKLEGEKRYLEAGALWERLADTAKAVQAYRRGGRLDRAARLLQAPRRGSTKPMTLAKMLLSLRHALGSVNSLQSAQLEKS